MDAQAAIERQDMAPRLLYSVSAREKKYNKVPPPCTVCALDGAQCHTPGVSDRPVGKILPCAPHDRGQLALSTHMQRIWSGHYVRRNGCGNQHPPGMGP